MNGDSNCNDTVEGILAGALDLQVNAGPDHAQPRRLDALDTARYAQEAGLAGFVLTSHQHSTAPVAQALSRVYPGLSVHGSVTLNAPVGGVNPAAVEAAAGAGASAVWMPTHDARAAGGALSILDAAGSLTAEAKAVLDVAAAHGMIVASGRLSAEETIALFGAARSRGAARLVASHPMSSFTREQLSEVVSLGAYVEHAFAACMPTGGGMTPGEFLRNVRAASVESSIVTSGFGGWQNPPAAEGLRMAIAALLEEGLEASQLETLVKRNPARLLGAEGGPR